MSPLPSLVALNSLKERLIIVMFYAWRPVKRKLILDTNNFCVDSEKTSVKVVFCWRISERIFIPVISPSDKIPLKTPYARAYKRDFTVAPLGPLIRRGIFWYLWWLLFNLNLCELVKKQGSNLWITLVVSLSKRPRSSDLVDFWVIKIKSHDPLRT